jgi:hypothetical protein
VTTRTEEREEEAGVSANGLLGRLRGIATYIISLAHRGEQGRRREAGDREGREREGSESVREKEGEGRKRGREGREAVEEGVLREGGKKKKKREGHKL